MDFTKARFNMVEQQIRPWDVLDFDVLDALEELPREVFVSQEQQGYAYADIALPLPNGSYMLEPKIVARMVQGLKLTASDRVLEIGTGSGYATALMAKLAADVVSCDIDEQQSNVAQAVLNSLNINNIRYEIIDGLKNPVSDKPFNAIYVGGSVPDVPEILKSQLVDGGRLVVVVGSEPVQRCLQITRNGDEFEQITLFDTVITPLAQGRPNWLKATGKFTF